MLLLEALNTRENTVPAISFVHLMAPLLLSIDQGGPQVPLSHLIAEDVQKMGTPETPKDSGCSSPLLATTSYDHLQPARWGCTGALSPRTGPGAR